MNRLASGPDPAVSEWDHPTGRWLLSFCAAVAGTLLFMLVALRTDTGVSVALPPITELGYVELPPPAEEKKPRPPPTPPVVIRQPNPQAEPQAPNEVTVPAVPLEPSPASPEPADVAAAAPRTAQAVPGQPTRIASAVQLDNTDFTPLYNPKPAYPKIAMDAGIQGYVDVDLVVNEDGKVESFSIVSIAGHPAFGIETARVLPRWRFPPPRIEGRRSRVAYVYRVNFRME